MAASDGEGTSEGRRWVNVMASVWAIDSWVSKRVPSKSKMISSVECMLRCQQDSKDYTKSKPTLNSKYIA